MEATAHSLFERRWLLYMYKEREGRKNVKWFFVKKGDSHLDRQAVNKQCQKKNCREFPPLFQFTLKRSSITYTFTEKFPLLPSPFCYLKLLTTYYVLLALEVLNASTHVYKVNALPASNRMNRWKSATLLTYFFFIKLFADRKHSSVMFVLIAH